MRHRWTMLVLVALCAILAATAGGYVAAQGGQKAANSPEESPIVAAVPIQSQTRYATDAFGQGELRDSVTEVTRILIVRANGEMERKALR